MADSGNALGQFTDEIEQATSEVATDVKDSVGEMIEQNVQTTFGTQLTQQQLQQKQQEEQKDLAEARRKIKFFQQTEVSLKKVREENRQKEALRLQQEEEEKKKKRAKKMANTQSVPKPGQPQEGSMETEELARTRQESGKGHGVGG